MTDREKTAHLALSALLLAGDYVAQPEVWPGFVAHVERTMGSEFHSRPEHMELAVRIVDTLRAELAVALGEDPGTSYVPRTGP